MTIRVRAAAAACWVAVALAAATAIAQPAAMADTASTPAPASHPCHVQLRCEVSGTPAVSRMPAWTPGYYGLFDYAGNVRNFAAADLDGRPDAWVTVSGMSFGDSHAPLT